MPVPYWILLINKIVIARDEVPKQSVVRFGNVNKEIALSLLVMTFPLFLLAGEGDKGGEVKHKHNIS